MALSFVQKPQDVNNDVPFITNWTPQLTFTLEQDSSIATYYYYQLVLEVRLNNNSGTLLAKIKQRRNGYSSDVTANTARAIFDIRGIANSELVDTVFDQNCTGVPFEAIHTLGGNTGFTDKVFSVNGDRNTGKTQLQRIYVRGYQQYSEEVNAIPEESTTGAVSYTANYMQASLPLMTPRNIDPTLVQSTAMNVYSGDSSSDKFLSNLVESNGDHGILGYINYVRETDYHTIAFLNDGDNFDSQIYHIKIQYFEADGSQVGSTVFLENKEANGGWIADNSEAPDPTDPMENKYQLLYFGCGPQNLQEQTFTDWAYYTITGSSTDTGAGTAKTASYYFIKQGGGCKGFKIRRLAFRNNFGCYDYFNFTMKTQQTLDITRNKYGSMLGTFNKSVWRYNNTQRGSTVRQTNATLKETLSTDWITEEQAELLEVLLVSTDVYIVENSDTTYTEGVVVTDSSFIKKTRANDKLIQYTLNIQYANPINTNS